MGAEFFGSLALILGVLTRPVALGMAVDMVVAAWMVDRPDGFSMNWEGEGFEFHTLAAGIALARVIGGGAISLGPLPSSLLP